MCYHLNIAMTRSTSKSNLSNEHYLKNLFKEWKIKDEQIILQNFNISRRFSVNSMTFLGLFHTFTVPGHFLDLGWIQGLSSTMWTMYKRLSIHHHHWDGNLCAAIFNIKHTAIKITNNYNYKKLQKTIKINVRLTWLFSK